MHDRHLPAITTLTARSVILSVLMGYHPPELPVRALVRVGGLFDIAERTVRVALSRMLAEGDVVADGGVYRLADRLAARQDRQEADAAPLVKPWSGEWEMFVVTGPARPQPERVALRRSMVDVRAAELREGVWLRPDNLDRSVGGVVAEQCERFLLHAPEEPQRLARQLWDLPGWAEYADELLAQMAQPGTLAADFMVIAEAVRHLRLDPFLPEPLLPPGWPGLRLRECYRRFRAEYAQRLRTYSDG